MNLTRISSARYCDPFYLYEYIVSLTSKNDSMHYMFLDEIQEVYPIINLNLTDGRHIRAKGKEEDIVSFVDVILDLAFIKNIDLYVTGSNSKMLSSDIVTAFRDKATNIRIQPLSFEEFVFYPPKEEEALLNEYMMYGGMPLAVLKDGIEKENYLKGLFETTYLKDIIERHKIRKNEALDEICTLLATCVGDLINSDKISNQYKVKTKNRIYPDTVNCYINAFLDSFLLSEAFRYDLKGKN